MFWKEIVFPHLYLSLFGVCCAIFCFSLQYSHPFHDTASFEPLSPRSSQLLPPLFLTALEPAQREKKHRNCERWTPAHFRNRDSWVPCGFWTMQPGQVLEEREGEAGHLPSHLSGLSAPAPGQKVEAFPKPDWWQESPRAHFVPGANPDPRSQILQGSDPGICVPGRYFTPDKAGKQRARRRWSKDEIQKAILDLPRQQNWHQEPRAEKTLAKATERVWIPAGLEILKIGWNGRNESQSRGRIGQAWVEQKEHARKQRRIPNISANICRNFFWVQETQRQIGCVVLS